MTEYAKKLFAETGRKMLVVMRESKYKVWDGENWTNGVFDNSSEVCYKPLLGGDWVRDHFLNYHKEQ